jgi:hypothetical protein
MSTAVSPRAVTSLVLLFMCAVASMQPQVPRPPHIITDVVSVTLVPAHSTASLQPVGTIAAPPAAAVRKDGSAQLSAAFVAKPSARVPGRVHRSKSVPQAARPAAQKPWAGHRRSAVYAPAHAMSARRSPMVAERCRVPGCLQGADHSSAQQPPTIFVPLRDFGLKLQAKLPGGNCAPQAVFPARRSLRTSAGAA